MRQIATIPTDGDRVRRARERAEELAGARYPRRDELGAECDLVMKGGITSGVVYPLAACELARRHRFRSIGGSSAGAIAAAIVAAAEYGRDGGGFNRLAHLPAEVGASLESLFAPGPRTALPHGLLMAAREPGASRARIARRVVRLLVGAFGTRFAAAAALVLAIGAAGALVAAGWPGDRGDGVQLAVTIVVWVLPVACAAGLVVAGVAAARASMAGLDAQGFGICTGGDGGLTDWLSATIDRVAGIDRPLTFGDLWGPDGGDRRIDLQVMTTDVTRGTPVSFPFRSDAYLFQPDELRAYFPDAVVAQLVGGRPADARTSDGRTLHRFPSPAEVPVVVAARLSLSFPGLISAVPLYAFDYSRTDPAARLPVRCWMSDGGITANFPIHFFDALWPRRPTFAIDLRGYHPDRPGEDVCYPGPSVQGRDPRVRHITTLGGFLGAILTTMQYWADDAQAMLPGYRDRVVEVHLAAHEGGLNLRMPDDVVAVLAEKGRQAAEALDAFDLEQHQWARYLTAMAELQEVLARMHERHDVYRRLLLERSTAVEHYKRSRAWAQDAATRTAALVAFGAPAEPDFTDGAPRPDPVLRITPFF